MTLDYVHAVNIEVSAHIPSAAFGVSASALCFSPQKRDRRKPKPVHPGLGSNPVPMLAIWLQRSV